VEIAELGRENEGRLQPPNLVSVHIFGTKEIPMSAEKEPKKSQIGRPSWLDGWTVFFAAVSITIVICALIFHWNLAT